jgi:linoleoyl-CoA desaturase
MSLAEIEITTPSEIATRLKFGSSVGFLGALRAKVDNYFATTGLPRRDLPRMYLKTVVILAWFAASYCALIFLVANWWQATFMAISLGFAAAAIGFNIQHDGGHQAYSDRRSVNRLMAMTLDMLGGSSYIWDQKHNIIHHTYANITGFDEDIQLGFLGRLSPHQRRLKFHRLQHFYLWILYGFITIKWHSFDDFRDLIRGKIGEQRFPRPQGWQLGLFFAGKAFFVAMAFVIPLMMHSVLPALFCYFLASFVQGVTLSVVFQLAHCVEDAEFPMPVEGGKIENEWAVHQVETTVDFARKSRIVSWFTGGLNFQIEHHLFPRVCHLHYPALSELVEQTCAEFGISYRTHEKISSSIASHYRWLRLMGKEFASSPTTNVSV